MHRIFNGKARHGLRAISLTTYMLFSPALAGTVIDIEFSDHESVSFFNEI